MPPLRRAMGLTIGLAHVRALLLMLVLAFLPAAGLHGHAAAAELVDPRPAQVDALVLGELQRSGVPGASIALVQAGQLVYAKAYELARLDPPRPATPAQRWRIGSISKQFVAVALLLLQQQGRLQLDDPLGRHLPGAGTAAPATLRQLLTHTASVVDADRDGLGVDDPIG